MKIANLFVAAALAFAPVAVTVAQAQDSAATTMTAPVAKSGKVEMKKHAAVKAHGRTAAKKEAAKTAK